MECRQRNVLNRCDPIVAPNRNQDSIEGWSLKVANNTDASLGKVLGRSVLSELEPERLYPEVLDDDRLLQTQVRKVHRKKERSLPDIVGWCEIAQWTLGNTNHRRWRHRARKASMKLNADCLHDLMRKVSKAKDELDLWSSEDLGQSQRVKAGTRRELWWHTSTANLSIYFSTPALSDSLTYWCP